MPVHKVANDADFTEKLNQGGTKLIVVDFSAAWCGPCKNIAPYLEELSNTYPNAHFLNVDVDECQETAAAYGITAMPTFIFLRNKTRLALVKGADKAGLEAKIKQFYTDASQDEEVGVKGMMDLSSFLEKNNCECLNEDDDHPYAHCLTSGGGYLASDCDEQLILSLTFNQSVKIHSLKVKAPADKGPKTVRIFQNQPNTLDFDKADSMISVQDIEITPEQLDGSPISLKFVKFQNVQNLQFFFKDNQSGDDVTQIDYLSIIGTPITTTNMSDFKRVAGKKGESHN